MKTNLDQFYKTDKALETQGIWFNISEECGFLMRRFGGFNSTEVKKAMAKYYKPFSKMIKAGTLPADKENLVMVKTFVEASMIDWRGVEIDGEEVDYSFDAAVKLLVELPQLAETLIEYASSYESFKEELGNS
jgi:hypothetical protein